MARERVDELEVTAAGQRFQICRRGSSWPAQPVPSEGLERGLWSADGYAHVRTQRIAGTTPLRLEVFDAHPDEPVLRGCQHVAEVSLALVATWRCSTATLSAPTHHVRPSRCRLGRCGYEPGGSG